MKAARYPLHIGITRAVSEQTSIVPIELPGKITCAYCNITCPNTDTLPEPLFYEIGQQTTKGPKRVSSCAFCTQCRHMNTVGAGRGEIIIAPYISQANLILFYITAQSGIELSRIYSSIVIENPEKLTNEENEKIQSWITVRTKAQNRLKIIRGTGASELLAVNPKTTPVAEQIAIVNYLIQQKDADYTKALKVLVPNFRYLPRDMPENERLIKYFAENTVEPTHPIETWQKLTVERTDKRKRLKNKKTANK